MKYIGKVIERLPTITRNRAFGYGDAEWFLNIVQLCNKNKINNDHHNDGDDDKVKKTKK